jgi:hypothetical protein
METPAEYFTRIKAAQWQALKMLGHSASRIEELKRLNERSSTTAAPRASDSNGRPR